jgi:glutamate 5-kinase
VQDAGSSLDPRAAAAVGQSELMAMYDAMFSQYNVKIAQVIFNLNQSLGTHPSMNGVQHGRVGVNLH